MVILPIPHDWANSGGVSDKEGGGEKEIPRVQPHLGTGPRARARASRYREGGGGGGGSSLGWPAAAQPKCQKAGGRRQPKSVSTVQQLGETLARNSSFAADHREAFGTPPSLHTQQVISEVPTTPLSPRHTFLWNDQKSPPLALCSLFGRGRKEAFSPSTTSRAGVWARSGRARPSRGNPFCLVARFSCSHWRNKLAKLDEGRKKSHRRRLYRDDPQKLLPATGSERAALF